MIGGLLMLFALMAMPHIFDADVIKQIGSTGLPYIVKTVLGNTWGNVFLVCAAVAITVCALAVQTAGIRIMFTMGRDGGCLLVQRSRGCRASPRRRSSRRWSSAL